MHLKTQIIRNFKTELTHPISCALGVVHQIKVTSPRPMLSKFSDFPFVNNKDEIKLGDLLKGPYGIFRIHSFSKGTLNLTREAESFEFQIGSAGATYGAGIAVVLSRMVIDGVTQKHVSQEEREKEFEKFLERKAQVLKNFDELKNGLNQKIKEIQGKIAGEIPLVRGETKTGLQRELNRLNDFLSVIEPFEMLVDDATFDQMIGNWIKNEGLTVESAIEEFKSSNIYNAILSSLPSLSDSRTEIEAIFNEIATGGRKEHFEKILNSGIKPLAIVAEDMSIQESIILDPQIVRILALRHGGPTSHLFVAPNSKGIHCVYGLNPFFDKIRPGDVLLVDGLKKLMYVNPERETLYKIRELARSFNKLQTTARHKFHHKNPRLRSSHRKGKIEIVVRGNAASLDDYREMIVWGLNEAGLCRTELEDMRDEKGNFLTHPKSEEDLIKYNQRIFESGIQKIIKRTVDLRHDKPLPGYQPITFETAGITVEGLELCLAYHRLPHGLPPNFSREIFKPYSDYFHTQLRALLQVSGLYPEKMKIEFPYVQSYEEWKKAYEFFEKVKQELTKEGKKFDHKIQVGVMVEVPWLVGDELRKILQEADFASFGGNDMLRAFFHMDRDKPFGDVFKKAYDPQFLKLLKETAEICKEASAKRGKTIPLQSCGEIASDLLLIPVQIGLGVDELSVSAPKAPIIKHLISYLNKEDLETFLIPRIFSASNEITARIQAIETYRELQKIGNFPKGKYFEILIHEAEEEIKS